MVDIFEGVVELISISPVIGILMLAIAILSILFIATRPYVVRILLKFLATLLFIKDTELVIECTGVDGNVDSGRETVVFSHGFGDNKEQFDRYSKSFDGYGLVRFNYSDAVGGECIEGLRGMIKRTRSFIGQGRDLEYLTKALSAAKSEDGVTIGYGISRGAVSWINWFQRYDESMKIDALILDSPCCHFRSVAVNLIEKYIPGAGRVEFVQNRLVDYLYSSLFSNFLEEGEHPVNSIDFIPCEIPILFIHSRSDELINYGDTFFLYQSRVDKLTREGMPINVQLRELYVSKHARLSPCEEELYSSYISDFLEDYVGSAPQNSNNC